MLNIKNEVIKIIKKYNTNNPFEFCDFLGIWVYVMPLGQIEGHYTYNKRKKVFFINENQNNFMRLGFSRLEKDEIEKGIKIIGETIDEIKKSVL